LEERSETNLDNMSLEDDIIINSKQLISQVCFNFVLFLKPAVPMSVDTLRKIVYTNDSILVKYVTHFPSLQQLLTKKENSSHTEINVFGARHRYVNCGQAFPGLIVEHLPCTDHIKLISVLQILHQQSIFNELYSSCFNSNFPEIPANDKGEIISFEVTSEAPSSINVTCIHPKTGNLLCLELIITTEGDLKCIMHTVPDDPILCSNIYLTKIVTACHSIPMLLYYMLSPKLPHS